jgi:endonuclease/exonuclease/phosphatase family metal-dependent hydrolase
MRLTLWLGCCLVGGMVASLPAEEFRILAWNIESNRPEQPPVSDPPTIAAQLTELMRTPATRASLVALSEIEPSTFALAQQAVANGWQSTVDYVTSASGGYKDSDSLMLIVDRQRFEIREAMEIHRYAGFVGNFNITDPKEREFGALRARSPLAVKVLDKQVGGSFWVIVNHLARGEADLRVEQAKMLRAWAAGHPEPIVAVGDFNFDFDFRTAMGNAAFQAMLETETWSWLKPDPLIDSNWSDDRRAVGSRVDRYPDSLLDFAFVANQAKRWGGKCEVIVRPGDFPDDEKTSDHRPILVTLSPQPPVAAPPVP